MQQMRDSLGAVVLAGGRAARFGGLDKASLVLPEGETLLQRLVGQIAAAGIEDIALVGCDQERYRGLGLPVVSDLRQGVGPLAGVEAALHHFRGRRRGVLLLPCDLPAITAREIGLLCQEFLARGAAVVVAETAGGERHHLCAVVSVQLAQTVTEAIDAGTRRVSELWKMVGAEPVYFPDARPFYNVNTEADWQEWLSQRDRRVVGERG